MAQNFNSALEEILEHAVVVKNQSQETPLRAAAQSIIDTVRHTTDLTHQLFAGNGAKDDTPATWDLNVLLLEAVNQIEDLFAVPGQVAIACDRQVLVQAARGPVVAALNSKLQISGGGVLLERSDPEQLRITIFFPSAAGEQPDPHKPHPGQHAPR